MEQESYTQSPAVQNTIDLVQALSVLVITHPGKWKHEQFQPSPSSLRRIEWFEGTGTVIGMKRNRVFIISSIHCTPTSSYSFFVKGGITGQEQVPATLSVNRFEETNNGLDIALFSCSADCFDKDVLQRMTESLRWDYSAPLIRPSSMTRLSLIHFPTLPDEQDITRRLHMSVFPEVTTGVLFSVDVEGECFDSTILATAGSSGGLIVSEDGCILGSHDSQHDETPDGSVVSTHRMCGSVVEALSLMRRVNDFFPSSASK